MRWSLLSLRRLVVRAATLSLVVPTAVLVAPPSALAAGTVSTVTAASEVGDVVGGGGTFAWRPGFGSVTAARDDQGRVVITTSGGGWDAFTFTLAGPEGADLAVGSYAAAHDFASRTASQPGLEITAGGRSCATSSGHFEVKDFAADLSHLLISYESGCGGGRPSTFGEIRVGMPVPAGPLVTPSAFAFPDTVPGQPGRGVPVYIDSDSFYPSVTVATEDGSSEFPVSFNTTCLQGVMYGHGCTAVVGFNPSVYGPRSANLIVKASGITQVVPLTGTGTTPITVGRPPASVVALAAGPAIDLIGLHWLNPSDADWTETIVRGAAGTTPPATIHDGFAVYAGRAENATAGGLKPGGTYAFSAFARDVEGLVATPATIVVPGTKVTLSTDRVRAVWGQNVVVTGKVTDAVNGKPIGGNDVSFFLFDAKGKGTYFDDAKVNADGTYRYVLRAAQTGDLMASAGDLSHLGGQSSKVHLTVSTLMTLASKSSVARGTTLTLTATAKPVDTTTPIVFEQKVGTKWTKVATAKANRKGVALAKVKPTRTGTVQYRARRAGTATAAKGTSKPVKVKVT